MLKKIASIMLCLLFVCSSLVLASCGDDNNTSSGTNQNANTTGFLNEAKVWEGDEATVTILGTAKEGYTGAQVDREEGSDEPVEDAFFRRNAFIEETYGIDIVNVYPEGDQKPIEMLRNDMTSGLGEYDAIVNTIGNIAPLAQEGLLVDFKGINSSYLHLDQAWWDQTLMADTTINGKVFFVSGDALVSDDEATWAVYFNKDVVKTLNLESPYDLVRSGDWTLDKMYEMAQQYHLSSGVTKSYDPSVGDKWGMVVQSYDFYLFMQGCEQTMIDNTGDVPVLRVEEEENISTFNKIAEFFINDDVNVGVADFHKEGLANNDWEGIYARERQIFANGNALFMPGSISYVSDQILRDAEIQYGILPMPKRSTLQETYTSGTNTYYCGVIAIPITNVKMLDATCYALEAMAYYGKEIVTPEYYDRTLTLKRFKDEESEEMLDLIFRNRTYDLGSIFNFNNGNEYIGTLYFYTNLLGSKSDNIISEYTSSKNVFQTGLDLLIAQCY